jgi:hypothetical protein
MWPEIIDLGLIIAGDRDLRSLAQRSARIRGSRSWNSAIKHEPRLAHSFSDVLWPGPHSGQLNTAAQQQMVNRVVATCISETF